MEEITYEILHTRNPLGIKNLSLSLLRSHGSLYDFGLHWHNALELSLVLEGSGVVYSEGRKFENRQGSVIFFNSGSIHSITNLTPEDTDYAILITLIPDEFLKSYVPDIPNPHFDVDLVLNNGEIASSLHRIAEIIDSHDELKAAEKLLIHQQLLAILYQLYANCNCVPRRDYRRHALALEVVDYVSGHYMEDISLKTVAAHVGLQENYFCRSFKAQTGLSFHQYLCRVRLDAALSLLSTGNGSVVTCALNAGFPSEKVLINWCRKVYNCTPLQYIARRNSYAQGKPTVKRL